MRGLSHLVSTVCDTPPEQAFAFLADGDRVGGWALGCWNTEPRGGGLFAGRSLFDNEEVWFRCEAHRPSLLVDYHVGSSPDRLVPRIATRVIPGPRVGRPENTCLVDLTAWRDAGMSDERWHRLVAFHEVEILLIQVRLAEASR